MSLVDASILTTRVVVRLAVTGRVRVEVRVL